MYKLINENIAKVLGYINRTKDIEPYLKMAEMFIATNVSDDDEYKAIYRKHWQLNAARLSKNYCNHYFQVMEDNRQKDDIKIEDVITILYDFPSNLKGIKTIQFSFATKLLHTINNTLPIYDSLVCDFYFLPPINPSWKYDDKLSAYTKAYKFLQHEQKRVLEEGLLAESIKRFREHFSPPISYTDQKIIDTLLWTFSKYARKGAIIERKIQYS